MSKPIEDQVAEYMDYCERVRRMSSMTLAAKRYIYKSFIEESKCNDLVKITNREFNNWIKAQTAKNISGRTINMRIAHLLAMLRYFREMGMEMPIKLPLIKKVPEKPPRRVWYTSEEITRVLSYADNLMDWLLIRIAFDTGLRITELRNLSLESFDVRNPRHIWFIGKGSKHREVYISEEAAVKLEEWKEMTGNTEENYLVEFEANSVEENIRAMFAHFEGEDAHWLWLNEYNRHMGVDEIRIRMRKVFEKAGYKNFYPHALRHSYATNIQNQGATIPEAQQMLGHSNAQTTERYLHGLESGIGLLFDKYCNQKLTV